MNQEVEKSTYVYFLQAFDSNQNKIEMSWYFTCAWRKDIDHI